MKIPYFIYAIFFSFILIGCDDDNVGNPSFDEDELPKIYMDWASTYVYALDDVVRYTAVVSPTDNITCQWTVNDQVVSNDLSVEYTISDAQPFTLKFEVERNGLKTFRTAQVTVTKPFEPKEHNKVVMGVVTTDANSEIISWEHITHLMYTSLQIDEVSPELKLPDAAALNRLKTIVSLAHNEGVYVIVDIAGPMNIVSGVGGYNQTALNQVAINAGLRAQLIDNIKNFVSTYNLDGVNISMNSANNDAGGLSEHAQIAQFMVELGEALPSEHDGERGTYFLTASIPMAWNNGDQYGYLGTVERLDWVNLMLFGATDLAPTQHAANWQIADNIAKFAAKGIPASKMLVGVGAFGVKYDIPEGVSPTWGTIDEYLSYPTYKEIMAMDATAAEKEELRIGSATIFYTGVSTSWGTNVPSKAGEAIAAGAKGMFVWTLDNDTQDANKSMLQAVAKYMNP